jgi:hypothetical protein
VYLHVPFDHDVFCKSAIPRAGKVTIMHHAHNAVAHLERFADVLVDVNHHAGIIESDDVPA